MANHVVTEPQAKNKPAEAEFLIAMDAVAIGVAKRLEMLDYSNTVMRTTVAIARQMRIPKQEIDRWVGAREVWLREKVNSSRA